MSKSEEQIMKWWENEKYDFEDIFSKEDLTKRIDEIKGAIPSKDKIGRIITSDRRDHIEKLIESAQDNFIRPQLDYLEEIKGNIKESKTISDLDVIKIDSGKFSYIKEGTKKLNAQLGSRRAFFERTETRKSIFLEDPKTQIERTGYRKWSAVQRYYELSDSELSKLKSQLGEDFLK